MKIKVVTGALLALAAPFIASAACPAGKTGADVLANQTRVMRAIGLNSGGGVGIAIGIVTFNPGGLLTGTATVSNTSGNVYRQASFSGRWMFDSNCANGMVSIMNGLFQGTTNNLTVDTAGVIGYALGQVVTGTLRPGVAPVQVTLNNGVFFTFYGAPVTACPPFTGGNALRALQNTGWAYSTGDEQLLSQGPGNTLIIQGGAFIATMPNPNAGVLTVARALQAPNQIPAPARDDTQRLRYMQYPTIPLLRDDYATQGRYTMNPDCTGGELLFMLNGYQRQYEFFFTDDKLNNMVMLSDVPGFFQLGTATLQSIF
jgi:hypothetical protein